MKAERVHHTGLTVSDIERSIKFYVEVLGAELLYRGKSETQGVPLSTFQNVVGVRGARLEYAFLKVGDTLIELICYSSPRGSKRPARHNDVGTPHIAFKVRNVEEAYTSLKKKGIVPFNPPVEVKARQQTWTKGWKFTYFRGPDGELLEIFQET